MQSSQRDAPANPETEDPLDGRDTLRLVRFRLVLTLLAVGIIPAATVAPIVRSVADESRVEHRAILSTSASHLAAHLQGVLDGVIGELLVDAGSPSVLATVVSGRPSDADPALATELTDTLERGVGAVDSIVLAGSDGAVLGSVGPGTIVPPGPDPSPPGPGARLDLVDAIGGRDGAYALRVAAAVPVEGHPPAALIAVIDLDRLLASAAAELTVPDGQVELRDLDSRLLASHDAALDPMSVPNAVLEMATDASHGTSGVADVHLPGLGPIQVRISAPLPVVSFPPLVLGMLAALIVILIGLVWWMARSILRPAASLEASRERLKGMYLDARAAALRDGLTGLGNHRAFQEMVTRSVDAARRYGTPFGLILIDVDEFKRINDTRGHAVGDELLATIGDLIRATARQADAGYRIGGDEFAIVLSHTDGAGTEALAHRLLNRALEERPSGRYRGPISFSAGVSACPEFATSRDDVTAQADAALYRGKRSGRTMVALYDPLKDRGHIDERMRAELSSAISAVIESGALSPVYQPIVDLSTGQVLGYEGLVRVRPEAGFAHTGALFDAAEVAGRVLDLDRAALDVVLRGAAGLLGGGVISLNVSPRSFETPEFNATVFLAILRRHGVAPGRVLLELTERDAIRDADRLRTAIVHLQSAGVRVAADDVGAGNAGLRLLSQFRFDVVKIDLSLVQGGAGQDQVLSVLTSIVGLAARWGALTVAEGVETPAQLRTIRRLGIGAGQGYLLGRPGPDLEIAWIDIEDLASQDGIVEAPPERPARATDALPRAGGPAKGLLETLGVAPGPAE